MFLCLNSSCFCRICVGQSCCTWFLLTFQAKLTEARVCRVHQTPDNMNELSLTDKYLAKWAWQCWLYDSSCLIVDQCVVFFFLREQQRISAVIGHEVQTGQVISPSHWDMDTTVQAHAPWNLHAVLKCYPLHQDRLVSMAASGNTAGTPGDVK